MPAYLALRRDGTINVISRPKSENFFAYVDYTGNADDALYLPIKGRMPYEIREYTPESASAMVKACVWDNLDGEPPPFLIYSGAKGGLVRASNDEVRRFFGAFHKFWDEAMLERRTGKEKSDVANKAVQPGKII